MKEFIIYQKGETKVYIHRLRKKRNHKTYSYCIRKDSCNGLAEFLGEIKYSGAWRQYTFFPDRDTFWAEICLRGIIDFIEDLNKSRREKVK